MKPPTARKTTEHHQIAFQEIVALVKKHAGHLQAQEMLAIAANMVGKIIALQDQRTMTPAMAMEIVARNIEIGNEQARAELLGKQAGSA